MSILRGYVITPSVMQHHLNFSRPDPPSAQFLFTVLFGPLGSAALPLRSALQVGSGRCDPMTCSIPGKRQRLAHEQPRPAGVKALGCWGWLLWELRGATILFGAVVWVRGLEVPGDAAALAGCPQPGRRPRPGADGCWA